MMKPTEEDQRRRRTVAEAEADYFAAVRPFLENERNARRIDALQRPMGFNNPDWQKLKAEMRDGDELWEFCSAKSSWDQFMGWAGYELVRAGQVVRTVITSRN